MHFIEFLIKSGVGKTLLLIALDLILLHGVSKLFKDHDALIVLGHTPANVHFDFLGPVFDFVILGATNSVDENIFG